MDEHLHQDSPFHNCPIFTDLPPSIMKLAKITFPWNKTADTLELTGVPPHVTIMAELECIREELNNFENNSYW